MAVEIRAAGVEKEMNRIIKLSEFESRSEAVPRPTADWGGWTTVSRDPRKNLENAIAAFKDRKVHEDDFLLFANFEGERGLFVDVGANMGFSAISFRNVNSTMRIMSFEILPVLRGVLELLRERVSNFDFRMCGISDHDGVAELFVPVFDDLLCTPLASLHRAAFTPTHRLAEWKLFTGQDDFELLQLPVELATLDRFALAPEIIKIDVEGGEMAALRGMERTLATWRPLVMCEKGLDEAFVEWLVMRGYRRYAYVKDKNGLWEFPAGDALPLNVIFVHESRTDEVRRRGVSI